MGFLNSFAEALAKDIVGESATNAGKAAFKKQNAITKMAKDAIFVYPAIYSQGILASDEKVAFKISRYLEVQYAAFTVISMGMNPVLDQNNNVRDHVASFYSAEDGNEKTVFIKGDRFNAVVSKPTDSDEFDCHANYKDAVKNGLFNEYSMGKNSLEARGGNSDKIGAATLSLTDKMKHMKPTMFTVDVNLGSGANNKIPITLAIKVNPRFITSDESELLFEYIRDDKPLFKIVQLTSGEISLFKDIIGQMDRAKKDTELYAKLGRHPFFRELTDRKSKSRGLNFLKAIPVIGEFVKEQRHDILPICSLIVTKAEIENGLNRPWDMISKQIGASGGLMEKMMLLCVGVLDTERDTVEFCYYGLSSNSLIHVSDLDKDSKDITKDMVKMIDKLVARV